MAKPNYPRLQLNPASDLWDFTKKLLVIDTDHKFLQHQTAKVKGAGMLPRPGLHEFLTSVYKHYNIILWTSVSIEILNQEVAIFGVTNHPDYKIAALLDRRSMMNIACDRSNMQFVKHPVVLWDTFRGIFSAKNTVIISNENMKSNVSDPNQGLQKLSKYLKYINKFSDFRNFNHSRWNEITAIDARFALTNCIDLLSNVILAKNVKQLNPLRSGKNLLVLDIDITMCVFINGQPCRRSYLDIFLKRAYQYYDIAIWSPRTMTAIDVILDWLRVLNREDYKIAFQLDRTTMIEVKLKNQVCKAKPLQVIWGIFPQFSQKNTIMIDNHEANLRLNPQCGLKIQSFPRLANSRPDKALLKLSHYLEAIKRGEKRVLHTFA